MDNSGKRIRTVIGDLKKKGFYSYFQDNGLKTWKLCGKHPSLKPLAFIYGFFRFLVRGTTGIIKTGKIKEQIQYIKNRVKFETDFGVRNKDAKNVKKRKY